MKLLGLIFGLIVLHCSTAIEGQGCPKHLDLNLEHRPCNCRENEHKTRTTIRCKNVTDSDELEEALSLSSAWDSTIFDFFVIERSKLEIIPPGFFNKLLFKELGFSRGKVNAIDKFAFLEPQNITEYVGFLKIDFGTEFNVTFLRHLSNLKRLEFMESNFLTIPDNAFTYLPNLESIKFFEVKFHHIGKFAFSTSPRLLTIVMTSCNTQNLHSGMFNTSGSKQPIELELSYNEIRDIHPNAFADLNAHRVNLVGNKLTTLNQAVFEPLLNSMRRYRNPVLLVDGNNITCDSSIDWLQKKPIAYRSAVKQFSCIPDVDCRLPKKPHHGSIIFMSGTALNSRVIYACDDGFLAMGNDTIECQIDGTWSDLSLRCLSLCRVPRIVGGFFVKPNVTEYLIYREIRPRKQVPRGTQMVVVCDEGFKLNSGFPSEINVSGNVICDQEARWWPPTDCVPDGCNCSHIDHNELSKRNLTLGEKCEGMVRHEEQIFLGCNPHLLYSITKENIFLECEGSNWIYPQHPDERCVIENPDSCYLHELKLDKGKISKNGIEWEFTNQFTSQSFRYGTELKFECREKGYELYVGNTAINSASQDVNYTVINCNNGDWIGRVPICKPARCFCSDLAVNLAGTGLIAEDCDVEISSGDNVQLKCSSNVFKPNGTLIAECELGAWSAIYTTCVN